MSAGSARKYYLICGEASGDLHASNLWKEIKQRDPKSSLRAWGGDRLKAQGATIVRHISDLAFMGFVEVLANLRTILGLIKEAKKDIAAHNPDVLILVDYPSFNIRIAEFAKKRGIRVVWYISPQVWAWKSSRVKKLKKVVDQMLVILPFEEAFYQKRGMKVENVGHPLIDAVEEFSGKKDGNQERPLVALLPGSRAQEIRKMLPIYLKVAEQNPAYDFQIAALSHIESNLYSEFDIPANAKLIYNQSYHVLAQADAALVTSGTATLETALFNVPQVVSYKANKMSYWLARRLVKVKYISLVNLILDRELVHERLQKQANPEQLSMDLDSLLDPGKRTDFHQAYQELRKRLGGPGASSRAADLICGKL